MAGPHDGLQVMEAGAPVAEASLVVVMLHGRGGSASDILGLARAFALEDVAYVAPQAAGGTWYPLSFLAPREANEPYLSSALGAVAEVVEGLMRAGVSRERIVLAGFSQGACLATEFIAAHPARYGGLLAFTGGLIGPDAALERFAGAEAQLGGMPALLLSGDPDPHVPWKRVEDSALVLRSLGAAVETRRYPGRPHTVTSGEVELARELLVSAGGR